MLLPTHRTPQGSRPASLRHVLQASLPVSRLQLLRLGNPRGNRQGSQQVNQQDSQQVSQRDNQHHSQHNQQVNQQGSQQVSQPGSQHHSQHNQQGSRQANRQASLPDSRLQLLRLDYLQVNPAVSQLAYQPVNRHRHLRCVQQFHLVRPAAQVVCQAVNHLLCLLNNSSPFVLLVNIVGKS